ncbi:hypothetical protein [Streptomyces sp. NRRL F-5126]|uniref:hypothetical protein n=1 Tax=Streptomyces sp. NRRL F-5126 TaxID=1463857 RepID=UPI0004C7B7F6|nr:hypothetical protein [Streptomyces sp. NRRL F-5126]
MISMTSSFISTAKLADQSFARVSLGFPPVILNGTGMSGVFETRPVSPSGLGVSFLPVCERVGNERPTGALVAGAAEQAEAYVSAAASAGAQKQQTTTHDHEMWAFRGPEPWSHPA